MKDSARQHAKPFQCNLNDHEKVALEILADKKGVSMSTYVRMKICEEFSSMTHALSGQTQIDMTAFPQARP